ncbi:hypothetical protein V6N13_047703 [Hibiscus sabdariffa]
MLLSNGYIPGQIESITVVNHNEEKVAAILEELKAKLFRLEGGMSYFEMQGLFEKDPNGDEVLTGVRYYVVSANWGLGGEGLDIGRESDRRCPGNRRSESINDDKRNAKMFPSARGELGMVIQCSWRLVLLVL